MVILIDLDDTLVNSTALNNDAYNYALEMFGYDRIVTDKRITREILLDNKNKNEIIDLKQRYFSSAWLPYRVCVNEHLIQKIKMFDAKNCCLWTKADVGRVNAILDFCHLKPYFERIIYDKKQCFERSMTGLKAEFNNTKMIIYENNHAFFKGKKCKVIDHIQNQNFDVKGYLV